MRRGLAKLGWVLRLAFGKMLEGPGLWLRAASRGVFGLMPRPWQAAEHAIAAYLSLSDRMAQVAHLDLGLWLAKTVVLKAETATLARMLRWSQDGGHPSTARPFAW